MTEDRYLEFLTAEQVRVLYLQAPVSNITVYVISLLFYFILDKYVDAGQLQVWVLLMFATASYRLLLWYRHRSASGSLHHATWLMHYTIGSVLVGISWSLVYLFLREASEFVVIVSLYMLIFGVLSSAVAILSPYLPAFIGYAYPQIMVLVAVIYEQSDPSLHILIVALLIYMVMLTLFARNANRQFKSRVMLDAENHELVGQLNDEIQQREEIIGDRTAELSLINEALKKEIFIRKDAEAAQKRQTNLLRSVLDSTPDLIFIKNYMEQDGVYMGCNDAFCEFVGRDSVNIIGCNDNDLFGDEIGEFFRDKDREMLDAGATRINEEWVTYPDGRKVLLSTLKTPFYDQNNRIVGVLGVSRDITEQKKTEEKLREQEKSLRHLAHHDPLTGLPNRLLMIDRLDQAIKEAERSGTSLALLFIDLDQFKEINDSLGHSIGDQLLKAVAERLQHLVRKQDTVARLGGDEFTVIFDRLGSAELAGILAGKIVEAFREPLALPTRELNITTSIGISLYPADGKDTETLLRNADAAMYRSKSEGRNTYRYYSADMTEKALLRVAMETELRQAIAEQQFCVLYQPQIDFSSRQLVGAEALLRWRHPKEGLLMPETFIAVAEESGLIEPIEDWVIEEVCKHLKDWEQQGLENVRIAVNLSGRHIASHHLSEEIADLIKSTGCNPHMLEMEITESFLVQHPEKSRVALEELSAMGIRLAIDNFGTGYSSLSYLKQYPISKLKIDASFVRDIPIDSNDRAIAAAVIALGKSLGMSVIGEGVENYEQASFLIEQGCDMAQGHYFSDPLNEDEFQQFWQERLETEDEASSEVSAD